MPPNSFTVLANARLAAQSRVYSNSCCPDKDLVVLFSRLGGNDRMSLWSINQGTKKWETDIGDSETSFIAVAMAWSPDGQSIAVAREPPSLAVYSIQNGHRTHVLSVPQDGQTSSLCGVWWFTDEDSAKTGSNIPDIFKRNGVVTGSAHSILKILPLLDHLQEENDNTLTATDLFAFQGSRNLSHRSRRLPDVIEKWSTLASDPISASIGTSSYSKSTLEKAELDAMDNLTLQSILLAADNHGHIFPFLDGIYPLGSISVGKECGFLDFVKHPSKHAFLGQLQCGSESRVRTELKPTILTLPLLSTRKARDLAKLSSTARELVWYLLRIVKEMREAWYGSESQTGAREFGPKWISALEAKQKEFSAEEEEPDPILDLTSFLTTGRASEALSDFLGSGQDMSERGINKWESTVTDALIKLRDFGEKRCATALQRLFLVLDELVGWSKLSEYSVFQLSVEDLHKARDLAGRGIIIAHWLALKARNELPCFREFIYWLRYEVTNIVLPNDANTARHDILEVNQYFISGLTESSIDRWFIGPVPSFKSADLDIPELSGTTVSQAISRAREAVKECEKSPQCAFVRESDLSHLDRNLDALMSELAEVCQRVFSHAAGATSRSAVVSSESSTKRIEEEARLETAGFSFRERTALTKDGEWEQKIVVHVPFEDSKSRFLLARVRVSLEAKDLPPEIGVALLECYLPEEAAGEGDINGLNAEFFDDESLVIVYRIGEGERYIGVVNYGEAGYQSVPYVKSCTREDLMERCMELWRGGEIEASKIAISRRRLLMTGGGETLALNGRTGRRVGCVLDGTGTQLETFDLEGEGEDVEMQVGADIADA